MTHSAEHLRFQILKLYRNGSNANIDASKSGQVNILLGYY